MKFISIANLIGSLALASAEVTLREAARDFMFGSSTDYYDFESLENEIIPNTYNTIVAENSCKLYGIQVEQGVYDFTNCDADYEKSVELGLKFRGHCLIWHSYQPDWFQNLKGDDLRNAIVDHITTVMNHYKGKIDIWDVVNEAVSDDATGEGITYRDSYLYKEVPDFIDLSFKTAREVDPSVKLFYNDYDTEGTEIHKGKTQSAYNLVKDLVERGVPIDGVGIQYHINTENYPKYEDVLELFNKYADLGLEVQITEMDIMCNNGGTEEEFALQAKLYEDALRACLNSKNCTGFLVWGVNDTHSWKSDGYPLLIDKEYKPKPAYNALIKVFNEHFEKADEVSAEEDALDENSAEEVVDAEIETVAEDSSEDEN